MAAASKAAALMAEQKSAAPYVAVFRLPFWRVDVFKELSKFDDPLDYPAASFHHTCRLKTGRIFEPSNSSGAGIYDTTRQASSFAPGLVRTVEKRSTLASEPPVVSELVEFRAPEMLRWKLVRQSNDDSFLPIVGEDLDKGYVPGHLSYNAVPGQTVLPELVVHLENAPYIIPQPSHAIPQSPHIIPRPPYAIPQSPHVIPRSARRCSSRMRRLERSSRFMWARMAVSTCRILYGTDLCGGWRARTLASPGVITILTRVMTILVGRVAGPYLSFTRCDYHTCTLMYMQLVAYVHKVAASYAGRRAFECCGNSSRRPILLSHLNLPPSSPHI